MVQLTWLNTSAKHSQTQIWLCWALNWHAYNLQIQSRLLEFSRQVEFNTQEHNSKLPPPFLEGEDIKPYSSHDQV